MVLPTGCGTYALVLTLAHACVLDAGALGKVHFPASTYVYLGSAHGSGGLRARLGRHVAGQGKRHWHIDVLRRAARVVGFVYALQTADSWPGHMRLECVWSQALSMAPGVLIPVLGFGASDCRSGCPAHLVTLPADFSIDRLGEVCALKDTLEVQIRLLEIKAGSEAFIR